MRKNEAEGNPPADCGERFKGHYQNRLLNQTSEETVKSTSEVVLLMFAS